MMIPGADEHTPSISDELCPMSSTFDRLPSHLVGMIFGKLPIGDRVRMRLVSKSWRDVLVRSDFQVKPEPPWLILPIDTYGLPGYLDNETWFESLSEKRTYRFELPSSVSSGDQYRWCCCGSSSDGGWLLMAGRRADHDLSSTTMMLWDPISGTTKRLPALSTLPFFGELVDNCTSEGLDIFSTPAVIARAQVFSVGSVECVVAVVFSGNNLDDYSHRLALCSPQDQSWSIVPYGPDEYYSDILFHRGYLYAICNVMLVDTGLASSGPPGVRRTQSTVRLSCCDVKVTKLEILYNEKQHYKHVGDDDYEIPPRGSRTLERWNVVEHLVGSSSAGGGELLVVCTILDYYSHNGGGEGPPIPTHSYSLTRGFEVYGLDDDKLCCLERLKQCLYVGATGSTSVEAAAAGGDDCNIIHFATNDADGQYWNNEEHYATNIVHERGVFDMARDKIEKTYCRYLHYETRSCVGWFTPKLC